MVVSARTLSQGSPTDRIGGRVSASVSCFLWSREPWARQFRPYGRSCADYGEPRANFVRTGNCSGPGVGVGLGRGSGGGWDPGGAGEEFLEDVESGAVVFACGGEVGAHVEEGADALFGAPAAGDLLLQLDHSDVAFGLVVVEGDGEVGGESQYVVAVDVEAVEQ